MTLSNPNAIAAPIAEADNLTGSTDNGAASEVWKGAAGSRDRRDLNGRDGTPAGEQSVASPSLLVAEPVHRPRRVGGKPATPSARPANGRGADAAASDEPLPPAVPTNGSGAVVAQGKRRSAATAPPSRRSGPAGALDDVELGEDGEAEADADPAPREPLTFTEVQAAHLAAARSFRDIRRALNESYRIIGRLNVERFELQSELAELKGLPLPERPPERSWNAAAAPSAPVAPMAARRLTRNRPEPEEEEEIDEAKVRAIGRQRQLILVAIIAVTAIFAVVYRFAGWNWLPNLMDRQAMADIAGIGILMQVFFLIFFLFRLGTLTGKGRSWLFPTAEAETFKRRRKRIRGH